MAIPTHKEWKAVKKKYGVKDGAGKNSVGKALDAYWKSGANTPKAYQVALKKLEKELNTYLTSLDKKKVKDYAGFEKVFLDSYLGQAHKEAKDTERAMATIETYAREIASFAAMVQKMKKGKVTKEDFGRFNSGPIRGMSAMSKSIRNVEGPQAKALNEINGLLGDLNVAIDKLPKDPEQKELDAFLDRIIDSTERIADIARDANII